MAGDIDLSSIKGFTEKKRQMKNDVKKKQAIEEINKSLEFFNVEELKYNHSVVLFCSQIVEDLYGDERNAGEIKQSIVNEVCRKYFNNDLQLVASILELVYPRIIKTNWFRRNRLKIRNFFLGCLKMSPTKLEMKSEIKL